MTDAPDLLAALTPVVEALDRLGVPYLLGGSVASSVHGVARATMDVDIVASVRDEHVEGLVEALKHGYYIDADMMREAIRERTSCNLIHQATMLKLDVFVPRDRAYDAEAMRRRRRDRLDETADARDFCVATAEDVVLAKLEWYDRGGRTSERQWSDVLGVLRVQGEAIDADYLRRWAPELGLAELVDQALAER